MLHSNAIAACWSAWLLLGAGVAVSACSTLADHPLDAGDQNLPNAQAGPFRLIEQPEIGVNRVAPYTLRDDDEFSRDVTLVAQDPQGGLPAYAYLARRGEVDGEPPDPSLPSDEIARHLADDGRSFDRFPEVVLQPQHAWEGGLLAAPAAVRVGGEIWLYYAAAGGIGLARSSDGLTFASQADPVLGEAEAGWDSGRIPSSPAVVVRPDGGMRMYYQVDSGADSSAIGQARSSDGISWVRDEDGPVLAPHAAVTAIDAQAVRAPCALFNAAEGRTIEYLYYTAVDAAGAERIAMAARYDGEGPFQRAVAAVFGADGRTLVGEPWVMRHDGFTLLFANYQERNGDTLEDLGVAVGVAPADIALPATE